MNWFLQNRFINLGTGPLFVVVVVVRFQSKWLGIAPWHKKKKEKRSVERLDKKTGEWKQISGSAAVGFIFYIEPGDGELFRITSKITIDDKPK